MAQVQIPNLPQAIAVSGAEQLEAVQAGSSVRVSISQIAALTNPWTVLTQAEYDAIPVKDPNTVYLIVG